MQFNLIKFFTCLLWCVCIPGLLLAGMLLIKPSHHTWTLHVLADVYSAQTVREDLDPLGQMSCGHLRYPVDICFIPWMFVLACGKC